LFKAKGLPVLLGLLFSFARLVNAEAGLLLEEPFGLFGGANPTGHAAVYLSRICAASPTELRRCEPGEPGAVISRYHRIGGYDWLAIPLIPYLFAVESADQVPDYATPQTVADLREEYRRSHLMEVAPKPEGEWIQLVGAAYDRKIYSFVIETTEEQDNRFIEKFNTSRNKSHFNLLFHNCADFSKGVINFYYPHAVHRSFFIDDGITTPKQIAKSFVAYSRRHSDLQFSSFEIPQVPGTVARSRPIKGVMESFLKTKKYALPVALLHPLVVGGLAVAYLSTACCDSHRNFTKKLTDESRPADIIAALSGSPNTRAGSEDGAGGH